MSVIEGIGDELTITVSILVVVLTLIIAWVSTRVSETRLAHARFIELTRVSNSLPEEEAARSTEGTENDSEQRSNESSSLEGDCPRTDGTEGESENDSPVNSHDPTTEEQNKESTDHSAKDQECGDQTSEVTTNSESLNQDDGVDARVETLSERTTGNEPDIDITSSDNDGISLKIKFLNESERVVRTSIEETVGNFKRLNFAEESQDGRVVHLIFNGQFLRDDSRQLGSYSIVNDCVLHCHISQHQHSPGTAAQQADQGELDLGQFMVPLFACTIGFVWYLRWQYSYMFNTMSTMSLSAVTVLFMLAVLAAWRG